MKSFASRWANISSATILLLLYLGGCGIDDRLVTSGEAGGPAEATADASSTVGISGNSSSDARVAHDDTATTNRPAIMEAGSGRPDGDSIDSAATDGRSSGVSATPLSLVAAAGSAAAFDAVVVNTTAVATFVLTNSGQISSTAITLTVTGAGFSLNSPAAGDCTGGTTVLAAGQSCTIHVSLRPTAVGPANGTLRASAMTGGSVTLPLSGTGVAAIPLGVNPTSQSFGLTLQGGRSDPTTFTVSNSGAVASGVITASLAGAEFASTDNCTGRALAPGTMCTIIVTFAPATGSGTASGTLNIMASPGGSSVINLSGTRTSLSLAPSTFAFASTQVSAVSRPQTFTVTNPAGIAGTITDLAETTEGDNPTDFSIDSTTCGRTLAAGATCTFVATFRPTIGGPRSATLLVSATPGGTATAMVNGTGQSPVRLAAGDPRAYVRSDGVSAVVFRDPANHIVEIGLRGSIWSVADLYPTLAAAGEPTGYRRADMLDVVLYRDAQNHLVELGRGGPEAWAPADLTVAAIPCCTTPVSNAPPATGTPNGYVRGDGPSAVTYRSTANRIIQVALAASGAWSWGELVPGVSAAAGNPWAYQRSDRAAGANQPRGSAVVYRDTGGQIIELSLAMSTWSAGNLTEITGAPAAAGDPFGYVRGDGVNAVVYRSVSNHIIEIALLGGQWAQLDLTALLGTTNAAGDPHAYVRWDPPPPATPTTSVVYRDINNHIIEMYLNGVWGSGDLTSISAAPTGPGDPFGYLRGDNVNAVVFRATDSHIWEVTLSGGTWTSADLIVAAAH